MVRYTIRKRLRSFGYAFRGIALLLLTQPNARIHLVATICVILAGWYFGITAAEWVALVLAMSMVWVAEALNTALEFLTDLVSPGHHDLAGRAKDVAAGAVLLAAVCAVAIGGIIFLPYLG
jgi:diacylglycerol kinase (ATP)